MFKQSETGNMKHTIQLLSVLLVFMGFGFSANSQSILKKADKEFELNAFNLAIKSYRKVLEKKPNSIEALSRLGDCYRHLNQMEQAGEWYEKALDQEGVDPVNLFYYGEVLKAQGKYNEAKSYFDIYAEGQPFFGEHFSASCDFALSMQGVPTVYRVKKEFINSSYSDFGPAFFKDKVVFSSSRKDLVRSDLGKSETWTGESKNQLFISTIDDNGYMTPPKFLRSDLANTYDEGPLSYSADGQYVAYTKNDFVSGTRQIPSSGMELSIYIAEVSPNGDFINAKPFPFNGSGYSSGFPSLSADGKTMYFSSNRPDGFGGWDIYVSRRIGETWTTPENLGSVVNSAGNEITPFFIGNSLYFSSDWHHGFGGLDIFRAERSDEEWTKVFHLGNGVNSPRDDYGLVFNSAKNIGYFTSNRSGGKGNEDIYQFSKRTDQILITVKDSDGNPIPGASIDFTACNEPVFTTDEGGNYAFQALGGLECESIVSKEGYGSYALQIESSDVRRNQNYEVVLAKQAEQLSGTVVSTATNLAVSEVYVRAIDQATAEVLEAYTDTNGRYALPLKQNTVYVIRYSKAGYTDTHNRVNVGDGSNKAILGALPFTPSTTSIGSEVASTTSTTGGNGTVTTSDRGTGSNTLQSEGYAIQLAAVYGKEKINTNSYQSLKGIGNLYTRPEKGYNKLRLGIFESRLEADQAKEAIVAKGFSGVFVVAEKLENMDKVEVYDLPSQPLVDKSKPATTTQIETTPVVTNPPVTTRPQKTTPATTPTTTPATTTTSSTTTTTTTRPATTASTSSNTSKQLYKIRLITYSNKNVGYFKPDKIKGLGEIEQIKQGNYTIMMLTPFYNLADADVAFEKVKVNGFRGAHIITEKDGKWIRVK